MVKQKVLLVACKSSYKVKLVCILHNYCVSDLLIADLNLNLSLKVKLFQNRIKAFPVQNKSFSSIMCHKNCRYKIKIKIKDKNYR